MTEVKIDDKFCTGCQDPKVGKDKFTYCRYTRSELLHEFNIPRNGVCPDEDCGHKVSVHPAGGGQGISEDVNELKKSVNFLEEKFIEANAVKRKCTDDVKMLMRLNFDIMSGTVNIPRNSGYDHCIICDTINDVEKAHIISREWAKFNSRNYDERLLSCDPEREYGLLALWIRQGQLWRRKFTFNGKMNLIPLCKEHNLAFGKPDFSFICKSLRDKITFVCPENEKAKYDIENIENRINQNVFIADNGISRRALAFHFLKYCEKQGVTDNHMVFDQVKAMSQITETKSQIDK